MEWQIWGVTDLAEEFLRRIRRRWGNMQTVVGSKMPGRKDVHC